MRAVGGCCKVLGLHVTSWPYHGGSGVHKKPLILLPCSKHPSMPSRCSMSIPTTRMPLVHPYCGHDLGLPHVCAMVCPTSRLQGCPAPMHPVELPCMACCHSSQGLNLLPSPMSCVPALGPAQLALVGVLPLGYRVGRWKLAC